MLTRTTFVKIVLFLVLLIGCSAIIQVNLQQLLPQDSSENQQSGLYIQNPKQLGLNYLKALVPLKNIEYNIQIMNNLAHISLKQEYQNPTQKYLNVYYSFPIKSDSSLYKLVAQFQNITVQGVVRQRQEAQRQFQKAKKQGTNAVITSFDKQSKDIIHLRIGNIPPKSKVKINVQYIQQLTLSMNKFYSILVPSTISPRYIECASAKKRVLSNDEIEYQDQKTSSAFNWTFTIKVKSNRNIIFYESLTHELIEIQQNKNENQLVLALKNQMLPNKDFNLVYTTKDFQLPTYVIGKNKDTTTVGVSFVPKFNQLSVEQSYKNLRLNKPLQFDLKSIKGEYVFILDRSGSMEQERIQKAKKALIIFLKSLPPDSYFNIVSFGSDYKYMFPSSQKYENTIIKQAIQQISLMQSDMGGTQIYKMLQDVLQHEQVEGYPKFVFMLTDGDVHDTQSVIKMVKKNSKNTRIYTIGIGNGASMRLIQGCASAGRGKSIKINDQQSPAQKIWDLLQSAISPLITSISLQYDTNIFTQVIPNPKNVPYLLKDDLANFYLIHRGQLNQKTMISLQYKDSLTNQTNKIQLQINPQSENFQFVDKMAHFKVLRALEDKSHEQKHDSKTQFVYQKFSPDNSYKKQAQLYSIKYQILSQYTSFLGLSKSLTQEQFFKYKEIKYQSIKVQQIIPYDYMGGSGLVFDQNDLFSYADGGAMDIFIIDVDEDMQRLIKQADEHQQVLAQSTEPQQVQQQEQLQSQPQPFIQQQKMRQKQRILQQLIIHQNIDGSWSNQNLIQQINNYCGCIDLDKVARYSTLQSKNIVYTKVIFDWLSSQKLGRQYTIILKKSSTWLADNLKLDASNQSFEFIRFESKQL